MSTDRADAWALRMVALALVLAAACARQNVPSERRLTPAARSLGGANDRPLEGRIVPVATTDETNPPWRPRVKERDWAYLVIHHTATPAGSVDSIHRTHLERRDADGAPWQGIGYHFVIGNGYGMEDGAIEPTFRWREQLAGAHAGVGAYNEQGIGICLVGNFEQHPPTAEQLSSLKRLVGHLTEQYQIAPQNVLRHGDVKATACPGKLFPMQEVVAVAYSPFQEDQRLSHSDR